MKGQKFIAAAISAASLFSIATPAFAATSDEIIAKQMEFNANEMCGDKTERLRGKCISDVLKNISRLKDEFRDALRKERKAWDEEHETLGISAEYSAALSEYTKTVLEKRKKFDQQQRTLEKSFFAEQQKYRIDNSGTQTRGNAKRISKEEMAAGIEKCAIQKDDSALRVCLRQQLRLQDPTKRTGPAGARTPKSQ
jgi:hypothetical protein